MYLDEEDDDLIEGDLIEGIPDEQLLGWLRAIRKEELKDAVLTTMCLDISHVIPIVGKDAELLVKYPEAHQHILECDYCWDKFMDAQYKAVL